MTARRLLVTATLLATLPTASALPLSTAERGATAEMSHEPITYTLSFSEPATHYVEVSASFPVASDGDRLELYMANWTPGSYKIRDYARHVEEVVATDAAGQELAVVKTAKNRWRISGIGIGDEADRVTVDYRVYGREMTVRNDFIDADFALVNGAATFLTPVGADDRPRRVTVEPADGWSDVVTALPEIAEKTEGAARSFRATDFDTLVDSPIVAGNALISRFEVDEVPHTFATFGAGDGGQDDAVWDQERAAEDVETLVRQIVDFWGQIPYERYVFLNLLVEAGGGLEHEESTVLMTSRWATRKRDDYVDWLGLVSHEFFHTWNVKRLRPAALGPFDYEDEVYSRALWIAEGVTSYYDDLLVHRAGLTDRDEYLEALSETIESVQETPGRAVRSLEAASFDAWIKHYQRDENTVNTTVSYYRKGAVVAFLLDALLERETDGAVSLDDAMRRAYERFAKDEGGGFEHGEFEALVVEMSGGSETVEGFLDRALHTTAELDFEPALEYYGLRFGPTPSDESEEDGDDDEPVGWIGADTEVRDGRLVVTEVKRDTPAYEAGLNVEDEILAIDDWRVPPGELDERLERYRPGDEVSLLVARRGELTRLALTLGEPPDEARWKLSVVDEPSEAQRRRLVDWLTVEDAGAAQRPGR